MSELSSLTLLENFKFLQEDDRARVQLDCFDWLNVGAA
jgi:hypothetical protein